MNKKYLFPIAILVIGAVKYHQTKPQVIIDDRKPMLTKAIIPEQKVEPVTKALVTNRIPAQIHPEVESTFLYKGNLKLSPKSKIETLDHSELGLDHTIKDLPRGMVYASSVKSVSAEEYNPSFGPIVQQVGEMVFFKPSEDAQDDSWNNVVLDQRTEKLYPISTVVKVLGISDSQRNELISKGLDEYYYHPGLRLLYVQSTSSKTLSLANDLKKLGYEIEIEAIKNSVTKR